MNRAEIWIHGGCKNNGKPGANAYGRMAVYHDGEFQKDEFWNFMDSFTGNQADYEVLIKTLEYIQNDPQYKDIPVTIFTPSQLMLGQLTKGYRVNAVILQSLCADAKRKLSKLSNVTLEWMQKDTVDAMIGK